MNAISRELLKPPQEPITNPAHRLDDASDRIAMLSAGVIDALQDDVDVDEEDLNDLRVAMDDLRSVLDDLEDGGDA